MSNEFTELKQQTGGSKLDETGVIDASSRLLRRARIQLAGSAFGALADVISSEPAADAHGVIARVIGAAKDSTVQAIRDRLPLALTAGGNLGVAIQEAIALVVSGTVSVDNFPASQAVTGPLTDAQLRASAVPVSAASLPLPPGASTEATLAAIKAKTDNLDVALSTRAVTGLTDTQLRASRVPVDGSGVTQPISGTVTANAGSGTFAVSASSLPLPSGASTEATLAARFGAIALGSPVLVTASGDTTVYTPSAGQRVRMTWVGAFRPDGDTGATSITVTVKIGATTVYKFPLGAPGAFAHGARREGAVDGAVAVSLSGAANVHINLDVQEF